MSDTDNIFPFGPENGKHGKLSEDTLMAYLEGKLSPAEQHEVEQWMAEDGMESDALEGLHQLDAHDTKVAVEKLNLNLRKTLSSKKRRRRPVRSEQYTWIAIAIILLLAVLAYIVIRKAI